MARAAGLIRARAVAEFDRAFDPFVVMLGWISMLVLACRLGAVATEAQAPHARDPIDASDCFEARATPLYQGFGWTHYVEVTNRCDASLRCLVATSVDPEPRYEVVVGGHSSETIRTRYGSNTYVYTPIVTCGFYG